MASKERKFKLQQLFSGWDSRRYRAVWIKHSNSCRYLQVNLGTKTRLILARFSDLYFQSYLPVLDQSSLGQIVKSIEIE